jgi:hypothetical protein
VAGEDALRGTIALPNEAIAISKDNHPTQSISQQRPFDPMGKSMAFFVVNGNKSGTGAGQNHRTKKKGLRFLSVTP